jgi:formate dehydrogenase subunit gamma
MSNHQETVIAFTRLQRSFHNHLLHFMVFFIITGLPLFSTSFSFLGSLFAIPYDFIGSVYTDLSTSGLTDNERLAVGLQLARIIHRLTALLFIIMAIPFVAVHLVNIRSWAIWPEDSWSPAAFFDGIKGLWVNYIALGHARFGKFNVGQKLFAWTMIAAITAITASGFVLMFRDHFSQGIQEFCRFVHAASFVVIGVFLIVHLYLSLLPMNRQALNAMFGDGRLPIDYAKSHHPIWYEKLTGKSAEPPSTDKKEQESVEEELTNF